MIDPQEERPPKKGGLSAAWFGWTDDHANAGPMAGSVQSGGKSIGRKIPVSLRFTPATFG
jgi:hypothetical protein